MEHVEPDELAAMAIDGRQPDAAIRDHLDECPPCLAEYEAFARTAGLGRGAVPGFDDELPGEGVWAGIHRELALDASLSDDPLVLTRATTASRLEPTQQAPIDAPVDPAAAPVVELDPARRRRSPGRWWWMAAAAAVVGIVSGVAIGIGLSQTPGPAPQTVLAAAELEPFPGWDARGEALVEQGEDGARTIVVDLDATPPAGSVREVWLIRSDASGLVSLGLLDGSSGRFAVPTDIDLGDFSIVDVSAEPLDGQPAHSGDSIVRGELR